MALESYSRGLDKTPANYSPLTPVSFLQRTTDIFPDYTSIITEDKTFTWKQTFERCQLFATALINANIKKGDTVSIIAPNTSTMYEAHFAIPMIGAVINAINTRLDPHSISYILEHSDSKLILVDSELLPAVKEAFEYGKHRIAIICINDSEEFSTTLSGEQCYEDFLNQGNLDEIGSDYQIDDEWFPISLSYTSGTTGKPKGVVTHHRGAYLNALGNHLVWHMQKNPVYLWTLPMFHCNGWCFPWTIAALAGTSVCMRKIEANAIFENINKHNVSHLCGAPIILNMLIDEGIKVNHTVEVMTAAAPPPVTTLKKIEQQGFKITHVYGLTEVYGPAVVCEWQNDWSELADEEIAELKSRQGVNYPGLSDLDVINSDTQEPVQADAQELGEVCFKGNIVMMGYYKDEPATQESFENGWFHSGDLAVKHDDGYLQLKDRSKDIIISGGENISTIEIENVLFQHPDVIDAAVVAKQDEKWGEVPCAFVTLKQNASTTENDIIEFCRSNMAKFKIPKKVIFGEINKTSTGKTQKFLLREIANKS